MVLYTERFLCVKYNYETGLCLTRLIVANQRVFDDKWQMHLISSSTYSPMLLDKANKTIFFITKALS